MEVRQFPSHQMACRKSGRERVTTTFYNLWHHWARKEQSRAAKQPWEQWQIALSFLSLLGGGKDSHLHADILHTRNTIQGLTRFTVQAQMSHTVQNETAWPTANREKPCGEQNSPEEKFCAQPRSLSTAKGKLLHSMVLRAVLQTMGISKQYLGNISKNLIPVWQYLEEELKNMAYKAVLAREPTKSQLQPILTLLPSFHIVLTLQHYHSRKCEAKHLTIDFWQHFSMKFIQRQVKEKTHIPTKDAQTLNLLLQSFHSFFFILQLLLHLCQFSFQPGKLNNTK